MNKVTVIGWYGRRNCGDEAFRDVHANLMPELQFTWGNMLTPDAPVVIISAGDIVSDFYFRNIPSTAKIIVYGVGLAGEQEIATLVRFRERLLGVWVRNPDDVSRLQAAGIANAFYTPDIVFNLASAPKVAPFAGPKKTKKRAIVTLSDNPRANALRQNNMSGYIDYQASVNQFALSIDYVAQFYEVVIVPFSFDRNDFDLAAIYDLLPRMRDRDDVHIIEEELTPLQMIDFFKTADLVVSMKFHGVVFALLNSTPVIGISNTRKVELICQDNGLGDIYMPFTGLRERQFKDVLQCAESAELAGRVKQRSAALIEGARVEGERFANMVRQALGS